jgi:hypothetical protein
MKRINYGEISYLVGDDVADLLVRYTARLSSTGGADAVEINVLGPDGNPEVATFALGPGIIMAAETTRSELEEPDNSAAVTHMQGEIERIARALVAPMTPDDLRAMSEALDAKDERAGADSPSHSGLQ